MLLVSFDFPWKLRKQTSGFLCFQEVSKETSGMKWLKQLQKPLLISQKNSMLDIWQGVKSTYNDNLRSDYKTYKYCI